MTFLAAPAGTTADAQSPTGGDAAAPPGGVHGTVIVGYGAVPAFPGAARAQTIPYLAGQVGGRRWQLALDGTSARVTLVQRGAFEAGPALNLTFGRERDDLVSRPGPVPIRDIGLATEVGAFASVGRALGLAPGDELRVLVQLVRDVSGQHRGTLGQLRTTYRRPVGERTLVLASASGTMGDAAWTRTYFAVDGALATATGLTRFTPRGGLVDAGVSLSLVRAIAGPWRLAAFGSVRRLVGDPARSPITVSLGDRVQASAGAGLGVAF